MQTSSATRKWFGWWLLLPLAIGLRPISNADLWHELAQGLGAIGESSICPNQMGSLFIRLIHSAADWHGLMLFKLLSVLAFSVYWMRSETRSDRQSSSSWWLAAGLIGSEFAWDPTSSMWDIVGTFAVSDCARRWIEFRQRKCLLGMLLLLALWANTGTNIFAGLCLATLWCWRARSSIGAIIACWLAACITPLGWKGIYYSYCNSLPQLMADAAVLQQTELRSTIWSPWSLSSGVLLGLSVVTGILAWNSRSMRMINIWAVLVILGWASHSNSASAAIGLAWFGRELSPSRFFEGRARVFGRTWPQYAVLLAACFIFACGIGSRSGARLGWGLSPELDLTPLYSLNLKGLGPGQAIGFETPTLGVAQWMRSQGHWESGTVVETPRSALTTGRLRELVQLREDLVAGRVAPYRRDDGTEGGWWQTLFPSADTVKESRLRPRLLMVSASDTALIRALEPALWKPLSLDAPVIPYAMADDEAFKSKLVTALQLRDIAERGSWKPDEQSIVGSQTHTDLWGLITQSPELRSAHRLARTLRAMQLTTASTKVLLGSRPRWRRSAWHAELAATLWEEAAEEALRAGRASRFHDPMGHFDQGPIWLAKESNPSTASTHCAAFAASFPEDWPTDAVIVATCQTDAERRYAAARFELLRGQPEIARNHFATLIRDNPDSPLAKLAQWEID